MSDTEAAAAARPERLQVDPVALRRQLRRLAAAPEAPWLHAEIGRRMLERLGFIKLQPARVLNWSAFLGASGEGLRQTYAQAQIRSVEPVEALRQRSLAEARASRGWLAALRRSEPAAPQLPDELEPEAADLLWANMYLHLSPDPQALLARWQRALAVDGFVMFSCLGPDSLRELRELHCTMGWGEAGPEWIDMHDIGDMLVEAGFADPVMDQERIALTWRDAQRMLHDLYALGGNLAPHRFAGLRTAGWRAHHLQALERLRGDDGLLRLSLELVYGHAFKPPARAAVKAETRIPLDQMRKLVRKTDS